MQCENYVVLEEAEDTKAHRCDAEALLTIDVEVMGKPVEMNYCYECYVTLHGE